MTVSDTAGRDSPSRGPVLAAFLTVRVAFVLLADAAAIVAAAAPRLHLR